ncbi:MAG: ATP-binding protein, partial [Candidatus Marinimicrobia bacterium]|nr:ATP-binding protein [Candidatus Neomarinimicrobiota bacterium]
MDVQELNDLVLRGEDSRLQFKVDVNNATSLAAEIVAFSNANGGTILIGVSDDGTIPGLESQDVRRINQLIANTASQNVRSPVTVNTENIPHGGGKTVIVLAIPDGIDKPYFVNTGVIWIKSGSDKRRINSAEELRRLFQSVEQIHADKVP